jgi:hypothetical protein
MNPKLEALPDNETPQDSARPSGEVFAKEMVTEKNVTEVSLNILGLDFRRTTSAEKQYTKLVSKNTSPKRETWTAAEGDILEAEVIPSQEEDSQNTNESKIYRAYLLKEPVNRTLHYLA